MKVRILQVGFGNNPGGVEAFVMNYYRELSKSDVQFDFLCMYEKIAYEDEIKSLGGKVFYVPNVKKDYFGYVKGVKKVLREGEYAAIHVNMLSAANITPLRIAAKYSRARVIAHSHNSSAPGFLRCLMDKMNRPKLGRYADLKFACGEKAGRWMFGDSVFDAGEVEIIRNAVDVEKYLFSPEKRRELQKELNLESCFVLGHVGRFEMQKNHEGLLDIFAEVVKEIPKARLLLIGDGVLRVSMEEKARSFGLDDKVIFAGVRSNVAELLSAMDLFLFPSFFEGLPFTLVEAQANGLPCVMSDSITEEVVLDKDRVRMISLKEEARIWVNAIKELKHMGRADTALTKKKMEAAHFDIKKEADRLRLLYQE